MDKLCFELKKQYNSCIKTLKETSRDTENEEYLCDSRVNVFDFDCITKIMYPIDTPKSFDALMVVPHENKYFLLIIEFKNQRASQINNKDMQDKLLKSQKTLGKMFEMLSIARDEYHFIFCVVYLNSNHYEKFKSHLGKTLHKFDLENFIEDKKRSEVITHEIDVLCKEFLKLQSNIQIISPK
ncbi:hypothetical protein [Thioflexithrix psekupsensis]|uniref:Uncharacterized protein n=1 Tax=Thioflexithrix psekupsensis TaxID=1570016 RepID=A0A251XC66_9GAMM|nr:hypothetical protein [Thioflexithrix psekupsensis]OUD16193.1 hypothetical protein TPSD3_00250 [Thioflexithrix psekupsensis]